ncbi:FLYWCH zinc finger domain-containing protein [Phthorimaea operculella]|nr:FLYWCH zinc finger domain-containing protein [Phthorimaea operculella]
MIGLLTLNITSNCVQQTEPSYPQLREMLPTCVCLQMNRQNDETATSEFLHGTAVSSSHIKALYMRTMNLYSVEGYGTCKSAAKTSTRAATSSAASSTSAILSSNAITSAVSLRIEWVVAVGNEDGRELALVNGHTFTNIGSRRSSYWRCTRRAGCKARFVLGKDGHKMTKFNLQHNHTINTKKLYQKINII